MHIRSLMLVFVCILLDLISISCYKNERIIKYDIVDFKVIEHRNKRTAYLNVSDRGIDIEIHFASFEKNFHAFLSEDKLFHETPVEFYISGNLTETVDNFRATFYEGTLKDNSQNSSVFGFMLDDLFTGTMTYKNTTYFIEPAASFFDHNTNSKKLIIYRDVDIQPFRRKSFPHYPENFPHWEVRYVSPNVSASTRTENSGLDISNQKEDFFCEIEIVVDYTLYNFFRNDTDKLSAVAYYHAKFADYVFRRADFNMDGNSDHIRIGVNKIHIYKSERDENYPMLQASSMSDYLSSLVYRKQNSNFCFSIAMSYRKFDNLVIGIAFRPQIDNPGAIGGVCDQPLPNNNGTGSMYFNVGVINMLFATGEPIPRAITLLAFAHEVGHAFGSDHDPLNESTCSPGRNANYLMYPISPYGSPNAVLFSPCSRRNIWEVLMLKGGCLKYRNSTCGNSIRENDEECDCGTEKICELVDSCCTPSDAKPPEKGCTIRSKKGFKCSPKESECCTSNCTVIKDREMLCYKDDVQCLYSFCDGKSAVCPEPEKKPDLCTSKFSCDNTTCTNVTLCVSQGLKDCICERNLTTECLQCCKRGDNCIPASDFGLVNADGKPFVLQYGTECNDKKYKCDTAGHCISNFYLIYPSYELYISMVIIPLFISVLLLLAVIFFCMKGSKGNIVSM